MKPTDLSIRQLRAVQAVASAGTFTAAASDLHITQPGISRTIREVEQSLGVVLFDRTTRRLSLTPAGVELLEIVVPVLEGLEVGLQRFAVFKAARSGRIAIATLPSLAAVLLPRVVADFLLLHPSIDFQIVDGAADLARERLSLGTVELALVDDGALPPGFGFTPLVKEELYLVTKENHPLSGRPSVAWSEFQGQAFIAARPGTSIRRITDTGFAAHNVSVKQQFNASNVATIGGLVRSGIGISALPALEIRGFGLDDLARVPIVGSGAARVVGIAFPTRRTLSPIAHQFLKFLRGSHLELPAGVSSAR